MKWHQNNTRGVKIAFLTILFLVSVIHTSVETNISQNEDTQDLLIPNIFGQEEIENSQNLGTQVSSSIQLDTAGDSFENATLLEYGTPIQLTVPQNPFYYRFSGVQGSIVNITVTNIDVAQGRNVRLSLDNEAEQHMLNIKNDLRLFALPYTGNYYLSVKDHALSGPYNAVVELSLTRVYNEIESSQVQQISSFAIPHERIQGIIEYLQEENLINYTSVSVDLEKIRINDPINYIKSASMVIQGLLTTFPIDIDILTTEEFIEYEKTINLTLSIVNKMNQTRLPNGLFYVNSTNLNVFDSLYPNPGEEVSILSENVYGLVAFLETAIRLSRLTLTTNLNSSVANALFNSINSTITTIANTFYMNDTISGYVETAFVNNVTGSIVQQGDFVYLESNSLLSSLFAYAPVASALFYDYTIDPNIIYGDWVSRWSFLRSNQSDTYNFLMNNLIRTSVPFATLKAPGIGVEYWNKTSGIQSNTTTLTGQVNLIFMERPGRPQLEVHNNDIAYVESTDSIIYNVLQLFSKDGLLVDRVLLNESRQSTVSNLYENVMFIEQMRQISIVYDFNTGDDNVLRDRGRSWLRVAVNLRARINEVLFDNKYGVYIPQYDHLIDVTFREDKYLKSNLLVANSYFLLEMNQRFDFKTTLQLESEVSVGETTTLYIRNTKALKYSPKMPDVIARNLDVTVKITLTDSSLSKAVIFDEPNITFNQDVGSFFETSFIVDQRGKFTLDIQFVLEGEVVFDEKIEHVALGIVLTDELSTTQSTIYTHTLNNQFTTEFQIFDEKGVPISGLFLESHWAYENLTIIKNPSYIDSSLTSTLDGKIAISQDVSGLVEDFDLQNDLDNYGSTQLYILLNSSNILQKNLELPGGFLRLPITLVKSSINLNLNPENIQIEQGTSEPLSITISVTNNLNEQIQGLGIEITLNNSTIASGTTSSSGIVQVTIDPAHITSLDAGVQLINITTSHNDYPTYSTSWQIFVRENSLQLSTDGQTNYLVEAAAYGGKFDERLIPDPLRVDDPSDIIFRVTARNDFGKSEIVDISLEWDNNFKEGYALSFQGLTTAVGSNVVTISAKDLEIGTYNLLITATKLGLTDPENPTVIEIQLEVVGSAKNSVIGGIFAAIFILFGILLSAAFNQTREYILVKMGKLIECPNCNSLTHKDNNACHFCGNAMPGKTIEQLSGPISQNYGDIQQEIETNSEKELDK